MPDTIRTRAALVALLPDNITGAIDAQDVRDFLASAVLRHTASGADQYILRPLADSTTFFQILDADGGDPIFNVNTTNERVGFGTDSPSELVELVGGRLRLPQVNEASTPTLNFGDGDTGFYEGSDDIITVSIGGNARWHMTATAFGVDSSLKPVFRYANSTATTPNIIPNAADINTGIGSAAVDQLSLIAGGVEGIRITEIGGAINVDITGDSVKIISSQTPASNGAGNQGEIAWDGTFFYGCVNTNTWGRIAWTLGY